MTGTPLNAFFKTDTDIFFFIQLHLWLESELPLQAYATPTATPDSSCICDLHCSLQQRWILNPLKPGIEPNLPWMLCPVLNPLSHDGNS